VVFLSPIEPKKRDIIYPAPDPGFKAVLPHTVADRSASVPYTLVAELELKDMGGAQSKIGIFTPTAVAAHGLVGPAIIEHDIDEI